MSSPDGEIHVYDSDNGTSGNKFRTITALSDGSMLAAGDAGLTFIRDGRVQKNIGYSEGMENSKVLCVLEREAGVYFAGTDGNGIDVIKDGKVVDNYGKDDGLSSEVILRLVEDKSGTGVFIVTSNNICYMDSDGIRILNNFPYYNNYDIIVKSRYTSTGWRSYDMWNGYYTWISNVNYILAEEETMSGSETEKNYVLGQAYAVRAYSYFMLAQMFSRTYKGHESEPCVPLYTEPTDIATEGKGRATVEEVYQQITSDLDKAITMLGNSGKRKHISHINEAVASGIKARVALVMEDWQTALDAANAAISKSGCSIGTGTAVTGGMNDATANNVMWAAEIIADQSGMYAGFFTHMDADQGKYGASARKQINKLLYAKLGTNDVRKKWWNPQDENNEKNGYQQEKFKFKDYAKWTGDYIFMRIEEMFLTAAEASCRLNDDKGARLMLNSLMQKRDEDYTCKKTGTALGKLTSDETGSLLEEIIIQRRIELWGEFGRIYDIRRLKQGFRRTADMGWPSSALIAGTDTEDPESYAWVLTIPQTEFDGNPNMDPSKDQNPIGDHK